MAGLRSSLGASYALLGRVGSGRFTVGLTAALVLEYESVCMESLDALGLTAEDVADLLDYLCQVGRRAAVLFRVRPSLPDPGDWSEIDAEDIQGAVGHLAQGDLPGPEKPRGPRSAKPTPRCNCKPVVYHPACKPPHADPGAR